MLACMLCMFIEYPQLILARIGVLGNLKLPCNAQDTYLSIHVLELSVFYSQRSIFFLFFFLQQINRRTRPSLSMTSVDQCSERIWKSEEPRVITTIN